MRLVAEPHGEPVEQLRVGRRAAHFPEVVRRVAQAAAEVVMPHAIHDAAPGERVAFVGEPARERGAARGFVAGIGERKIAGQVRQITECAGTDEVGGLIDVAAREQMDRARHRRGFEAAIGRKIARRGIDELRRGQGREFGFHSGREDLPREVAALLGRALRVRQTQQLHEGRGHRRATIGGERIGAEGKAEAAKLMAGRAVLLQANDERRARIVAERFL